MGGPWGPGLVVAAGSTCALDRALVRAGSEANLARVSPQFNPRAFPTAPESQIMVDLLTANSIIHQIKN
jgi:hypothetical protein